MESEVIVFIVLQIANLVGTLFNTCSKSKCAGCWGLFRWSAHKDLERQDSDESVNEVYEKV